MREHLAGQRGIIAELTQEVRTKFDISAAERQQIVGLPDTLIDRARG